MHDPEVSSACADAAATLIANNVNVEHPGIIRKPACDVNDDSDLGMHQVTVKVPFLPEKEVSLALLNGAESAKELLEKMPGIKVVDSSKDGGYPTAVTEAAGENPVFVGRIREDISHPRGLNMWVVSDNVRKGAALNSIQIADILVKNYI